METTTMNIAIVIIAIIIIWALLLKEKHRKIIRHYLITATLWAALAGAIVLAYYVYEWNYKRKHTIFIGDPQKPSWNQP